MSMETGTLRSMRSARPALLATALAAMLGAGLLAAPASAATRSGAHGAATSSQSSAHAAPRGEVFLNGRWVSSSWCDATVPGPTGGPGGPGTGLCNANTPRR